MNGCFLDQQNEKYQRQEIRAAPPKTRRKSGREDKNLLNERLQIRQRAQRNERNKIKILLRLKQICVIISTWKQQYMLLMGRIV